MTSRRRTMKENARHDENARLASIRRRERLGYSKENIAVKILTSSEMAKAVISKRGYIPES